MFDGVAGHSIRGIQAFLNGTFPYWIERGSHIPWLACTLDLNSLDFFLLEYVKGLVYDRRVPILKMPYVAAQHIRHTIPNFARVHNF